MSLPSLFAPVEAPKLRQLGRRNLQKFADDRIEYLRAVEERRSQPGGDSLVASSLRATISTDLLWSLVDLCEFGPEVDTISKITEDMLSDWMMKSVACRERISLKQLAADVSRLHMDTAEGDAEQRVVKLFMTYTKLLRRHLFTELIKKEPSTCVDHIIPLLQPKALQNKVERDLEFEKKELNADFHQFYSYVIKTAVACDAFVSIKEPPTPAPKGRPTKPSREASNAADSQTEASPQGQGSGSGNTSHTTGSAPTPSPVPKPAFSAMCLNSQCDGKHPLASCSRTSREVKKTLIDQYRTAKQRLTDAGVNRSEAAVKATEEVRQAHSSSSRSNRARVTPATSVEDDCHLLEAVLCGKLTCQAMLDNGSDDNTMSQQTIDKLVELGVRVEAEHLNLPVCITLTSTSHQVMSYKRAKLSILLKLRTGPLMLRNVRFLVLDAPYEEVILGRPLMTAFGIDFKERLNEIRSWAHNKSFAYIKGVGEDGVLPQGQLSRALIDVVTKTTTQPISPSQSNGPTTAIHHGMSDSDPFINDGPITAFGEEDPRKLKSEVEALRERAKENGLSEVLHDKLNNLCSTYQGIFALKLGNQPPAKFAPMKIDLKHDADPVRARPRPVSVDKKIFIRTQTDAMMKYGSAYKNNASEWSHPVHIVPKPGPAQFRFTVDLREGNSRQKTFSWPMPHLESVIQSFADKNFFATFDLSQGYWQLPLAKTSQECQSFVTQDGVFTPTRVLHDNANSVAYLQSCMTQMTESIRANVIIWLDDVLITASTEEELLEVLEQFFQQCLTHRLLLSPQKSDLFLKEVRYCGRIISSTGVRMDPRNHEALQRMAEPTNGGQLQQFVCALNWMRGAIPNFAEIVAPLNVSLEQAYDIAGGRTKKKVSSVLLRRVDWGAAQKTSFQNCIAALQNAVTLSHRDETLRLCVFTDASDSHWASVVTQVPPEDLHHRVVMEQRHQPLAFLSGSFKGATSKWSVTDKEAYPIIATVLRLDYLLQSSHGYTLFCDHRNLVYIFDPRKGRPGLLAHSHARLQRWAMILSSSPYTIEHLAGEKNVWADLLTRWVVPAFPQGRGAAAMIAPLHTDWKEEWPDVADIVKAQKTQASNRPNGLSTSYPLRFEKIDHEPIWIPDGAVHLQARICTVAHCGSAGHRGQDETRQSLSEHFHWTTLVQDVETFCNTCLHCLATIGGTREPRPFESALHATEPREVLHFDFLYIGPSSTGPKYLLLLKDDFSGYVWLCPHDAADSTSVATSMLDLFASFGTWRTWVSDQGSHFKNEVVSSIQEAFQAKHHFVLAYTPWANGTVESLCKQVLRGLRALSSQLRFPFSEWPCLVPVVQSILNNSPVPRLNGVAPLTALTGLQPTPPIASVARAADPLQIVQLDNLDVAYVLKLADLRTQLQSLHKDVAAHSASHRAQRRQQASKGKTPNFMEGDFVLVSRHRHQRIHKLQVAWQGPMRITEVISPHEYRVERLVSGEEQVVHVSRLKFYHDKSLAQVDKLNDFAASVAELFEVETMQDLRYNQETLKYEILIRWRRHSSDYDTWEPLPTLYEDVPTLTSRFLNSLPPSRLLACSSAPKSGSCAFPGGRWCCATD